MFNDKESLPPFPFGPIILALLWLFMVFAFAFYMVEEHENPTDLYCEMTQTYKATDGDYGWPDYKHIANEC